MLKLPAAIAISAFVAITSAGCGDDTSPSTAGQATPAPKPSSFTAIADRRTERETPEGLTFNERIVRDSITLGHASGRCSFAGLKEGDPVPCTIRVRLNDGTITVRGTLTPDAATQRLMIVSGSGKYAGVQGAINSRTLDSKRNELSFAFR